MNYGSLFTGAGGGDIGLDRSGMECRWQCEMDKHCNSVLARHWPNVKRYNDITTIKKKPPNVDVIIGGSPCQGFSVAGERGGMEDDRSILFREMVRIVAAVKPKYVIWENVPGVLSGYDEVLADEHYELFSWAKRRELAIEAGGLIRRWWLGAVLRSFTDIGYGGAYRIIDSQFFGVPQRRRRIFAVFARGTGIDSGTDRCRKILSFGQSVSRHSSKSKESGKEVAGILGGGSKNRGWCPDTERMTFIPDVARPLTGSDGGVPFMAFAQNTRDEVRDLKGVAGCLAAKPGMKQQTYLAYRTSGNCGAWPTGDRTDALNTGTDRSQSVLANRNGVRRLTPRECERLQSWPDDHTRFDANGKKIADGPRYRMIGNGMTSNVIQWIGTRIIKVESK